ncbi:MAG: HAD family hydrolase [Woeseiaceae bacterium]|nr:HAD family hydrolase [Woeseiaceae bacterium]
MKAIIFDIDGTLIESMAIDSKLYFSSVTKVLGPVDFREKLSDYDNVTDSGIISQLADDNGLHLEPTAIESIQTLFVGGLVEHIQAAGPFPAIHGATQTIDRLSRSTDYCVAIATGGWRKSALLKLESSGFSLDGIPLVSCDDSPSRTEIMSIALARLGSNFESATYFGDADWDRRACEALGWDFVPVGPDLGGIESYEGYDF